MQMPDTPRKSRPRGRPAVLGADERRRLILEAAEQVFMRQGYGDASMAAIAQQSGMSKKTVYALFPNKRALFDVLADDSETYAQVMETGRDLPPLDALRLTLHSLVQFVLSPRQVLVTRLLIAAGNSEQGMATTFRDNVISRTMTHLAGLLSAIADGEGRYRQEQLEGMAKQLVGCAMGDLHVLALVGVPVSAIDRQIEAQVAMAMALVPAMLAHGDQGHSP